MDTNYTAQGTLHKKFDTEDKSETFRKREFVLKTDGQYPQYLKFQLLQDRCDIVDPFEEGTQIKVHFDLRGKEWNGKYFTNLNVWRIENAGAEVMENAPQSTEEVPFPQEESSKTDEILAEDFDDLPF